METRKTTPLQDEKALMEKIINDRISIISSLEKDAKVHKLLLKQDKNKLDVINKALAEVDVPAEQETE